MSAMDQLIKVHLDLWPWLTFWGHFKYMNVKIAYIFLMVRDRHVVAMKHYWEFDIWLSESAHIFYIGWPWQGYFKAMKVKIAIGVSSMRDRSKLAIGRLVVYVHLVTMTVAKIDLAPRVGHPSNSWASCLSENGNATCQQTQTSRHQITQITVENENTGNCQVNQSNQTKP